jgi:hypothetical protein
MYVVRWKRTALDRVAELWIDADDRAAITAAVDEIDRVLAANPQEAGESRDEQTRVLFVPPLGTFLEVHDAIGEVNVLKVWTF